MRIALISDIHGHRTAFDAVLADIEQQHVDSLVCLGDVATLGPQPKYVLARLRELGCVCLLGNHDAALLQPERAAEYQVAPPLHTTLHWCAGQLEQADFDFVASFRPTLTLPLNHDATLLCFHGSPRSNTELILATTPTADLEQILAGQTATVLAGGHTHIQMLRQHAGTLIVNSGSVGSAFHRPSEPGVIPTLLPWAEYAIISWANGVLSVDLRRVPFDVTAFKQTVAESDIPIREWWLGQYQKETYP